jgi:hypothetical protein
MGAWGADLTDNDSTLDFLGDLSEKLAERLERHSIRYSDFYNVAIVLRGIISANDAAGNTSPLLGGERLAKAFIQNFQKAVLESADYEDFLEVLMREYKLIDAALKKHLDRYAA